MCVHLLTFQHTVEWNREAGPSSARDQPQFGPDGATHFTMAELGQATRHFSESSLIGHGSFGPIYKGLLRDTVVAIKRRPGPPRQEFVREVWLNFNILQNIF